ncbi:hypothetical protein VNI00_008743 [Paramarasmius palmivorus]|uniref:F-box domain-containing protein n=1 Tax=Paramarasmius palmivorus TaxID=297713 RepID=A0AAW0CXN4_9AGAR
MVPSDEEHNGSNRELGYGRSSSPIARLPPEILQGIFEMCCQTNGLHWKDWNTPALVLSLVSVLWRDIALSTSSLWSSLTIDLASCSGRRYHALSCITQLFLDRSKKALLTLHLSLGIRQEPEREELSILDALVQASCRWYDVTLRIQHQSQIGHPVFRPIQGNLPQLQRLAFLEHSWAHNPGFTTDLFSDCPSLSTLVIKPRSVITPAFSIPWQQIKTLRLLRAWPTYALPFVLLCPNIDYLELKEVGMDDGVADEVSLDYSGARIYCRAKALSLYPNIADEVDCIFRHATFPNLSHLQITYGDKFNWDDWNTQFISRCLVNSSCTILSLSFTSVPVRDEDMVQLLRLMPELRTLELEEPPKCNWILTESFLAELHVDHDHLTPTPFLPKLADLKLVVNVNGFDQMAFSKAVASRCLKDVGVDCIQTVEVRFMGDDDGVAGEICTYNLRFLKDTAVRVFVSSLSSPTHRPHC